MNAKKTVGMLIVSMFFVVLACESVFAQEVSIEQKLNKEIKISLNDVLITEALDKISKEIDVPITLSDEAEYKLSYGKSTRLSVTLKGPASESLTQMLNEFFMRYAVGQKELTIYPRPELDHIIGRPSARQLGVLKAVYTMPIKVYITDNVSATVNTALQQEVFISPIDIHGSINKALRRLSGEKETVVGRTTDENRPVYESMLPRDTEGKDLKEYVLPTAVLFSQLLRDVKVDNRTVEWYIPSIDLPNQTPEIRIMEGSLIWLKRAQLIDVNFENKPVWEILQTLADRGGIQYIKDPQAIEYLGECITVSMQNVTAQQAMKKIADMTLLSYEENVDRFYIRKRNELQPSAKKVIVQSGSGSGSDDRGAYVGKISIPMEGGKYYIEYMLRENDLTDELKKLRTEKIKEILGSPADEKSLPKEPEKTK